MTKDVNMKNINRTFKIRSVNENLSFFRRLKNEKNGIHRINKNGIIRYIVSSFKSTNLFVNDHRINKIMHVTKYIGTIIMFNLTRSSRYLN